MTEYNEITGDLVAVTSDHPVLLNYKGQITQLEEKVEQLTTTIADKDTRITNLRTKYNTTERNVELKLKELLDDEEISIENAKAIAELFDNITLSKQVQIDYTISATITVEVPYDADSDRVADNVFVERVEFYSQDYDYEVLEVDHDVDDYNVRY